MNNKMLHRGSMAWLTSTETTLPVLSTCILLLIQFQILHALPTTSLINGNGSHQPDTGPNIRASSSSSAYGSAYPYSSYRPGARLEDSYRPYSAYSKDSFGTSSGLYISHPNSVYSRQSSEPSSSLSQNLEKALKLIEQQNEKIIPLSLLSDNDKDATLEQGQVSRPLSSNNTPVRNNKPRLLPLPSIKSSSSSTHETNNVRKQHQHQENVNKEQQPSTIPLNENKHSTAGLTETQESRSAEFSPVPPPFAPELDPKYEQRQYGLGALTLLDQAGPFW